MSEDMRAFDSRFDPPETSDGPECPEDPGHGPMDWDDARGRWECRAVIREGQDAGRPDDHEEETCDGSAMSDEDAREADLADRGDDE